MRRTTPRWIAGILLVSLLLTNSARAASTVSHQLSQVLPELRFDGVALSEAIDFLRDVSGANIVVNWKALEGEGVSRDTPINLHLRAVTLRRALSLLLSDSVAGGKVGYTVDENVIEISTQELIDSIMYTRVYPIEDLIMVIPDFDNPPDFSLQATSNNSSQNGSGGGGGGGGSSSLFSGSAGGGASSEKTKSKTERANELMDLIRSVIQPEIWQENGGKAAMRYWSGNLIITAPRSVLEAIGGPFD
jgi:uncharacterized membrane protein YgcG